MWIEDIAYLSVAIESDRALIAAFQLACVRNAYLRLTAPQLEFSSGELVDTDRDPAAKAWLDVYEGFNFIAPGDANYLGDHRFALLVGQLTNRDISHLRQLQMMLNTDLMERDRIISQFYRTRRQAMRDAIEFAEFATREINNDPPSLTLAHRVGSASSEANVDGVDGQAPVDPTCGLDGFPPEPSAIPESLSSYSHDFAAAGDDAASFISQEIRDLPGARNRDAL